MSDQDSNKVVNLEKRPLNASYAHELCWQTGEILDVYHHIGQLSSEHLPDPKKYPAFPMPLELNNEMVIAFYKIVKEMEKLLSSKRVEKNAQVTKAIVEILNQIDMTNLCLHLHQGLGPLAQERILSECSIRSKIK